MSRSPTADAGLGTRPTIIIIGSVLALAMVFGVSLRLTAIPEGIRSAASDVVVAVAATVAATISARRAFRTPAGERHPWTFLACGLSLWAVAEVVWTVYRTVLDTDPYPSLADAGYLAAIPFFMASVAAFTAVNRRLLRLRTMVDAVALTAALAAVAWFALLIPIYESGEGGALGKAVAAAYVIADVIFACSVLIMSVQRRDGHATLDSARNYLVLAFAATLAGDAIFAAQELGGGYAPGVADVGWVAGYGFFAAAALRPLPTANPSAIASMRSTSMIVQGLNLATLIGMCGFLVYLGNRGEIRIGGPELVTLGFVGVSIVAVAARQFIALLDVGALNGALASTGVQLEHQVAERTAELTRLASILDVTTDFVATTDPEGRVLYLNQAGRKLAGLSPSQSHVGVPLSALQPPWAATVVAEQGVRTAIARGSWSAETALLSWEGKSVPVSQVLLAHKDDRGGVAYLSTIARDISEQKALEAHLSHLASHDGLTGLFNRLRFVEELEREVTRLSPEDTSSLAFIDLDHFKDVNDSLGHGSGDELLIAVAAAIRSAVRPQDVVARLGGDEFAVIFPGLSAEIAVEHANNILSTIRNLRQTYREEPVRITASAGVAAAPMHGLDSGTLLARADMAMYRAKVRRDWCCTYSSDEDSERVFEGHRRLERDIREAVDNARLELVLQPIVPMDAEPAENYEALLRVRNTNGSLELPEGFFATAERSGLIHQIDRWVIAEAARVVRSGLDAGRRITLHVNLSARALNDEDLPRYIRDVFERQAAPAKAFVFEVTETAAVLNISRARRLIAELKAIGCRFALDDFGVGYSSIAQLKHLDVDFLKIDGAFVANLATEPSDMHLVRAMVELARGLGKKTVAEYVGDDITVHHLRDLGVEYGQGFFLGRPIPASDIVGKSAHEAA